MRENSKCRTQEPHLLLLFLLYATFGSLNLSLAMAPFSPICSAKHPCMFKWPCCVGSKAQVKQFMSKCGEQIRNTACGKESLLLVLTNRTHRFLVLSVGLECKAIFASFLARLLLPWPTQRLPIILKDLRTFRKHKLTEIVLEISHVSGMTSQDFLRPCLRHW